MRDTHFRTICISALVGVVAPVMFAQQTTPTFVRDVCVKVRDGKWDDYRDYLRDINVKLAQVRVNEGKMQWWHVEQAVMPAGDSARCDYHIVSAYTGFPPEPPSAAETAADFERAKLAMPVADAHRRRDADSRLVNIDLWRILGRTGGRSDEGTYVRRNFYRLKPGHTMAEWARLETSGWMPFAEAMAKQTGTTGWVAVALVMPGGQSLAYQAGTVDIFPDWKSIGADVPFDALWSKVHPDLSSSDYLNLVGNAVDRQSVELYRIAHSVQK